MVTDCRRYGLLKYTRTLNLGDEIQSLAAARFLPTVDDFLNRDALHAYDGEPISVILNGWYTHQPDNWPPAPAIDPLLTSIHISHETSPQNTRRTSPLAIIESPEGREFFRRHGPVGARDHSTEQLLHEAGIDAFFSGCMTLTLPAYLGARDDYVCCVDVDDELFMMLHEGRRFDLCRLSHWEFRDEREPRFAKATMLLDTYARARLVITTRLHCALPCLAMGTPVIFIETAPDSYRFAGLRDLIHCVARNDLMAGYAHWWSDDFLANKQDHIGLRTHLMRQAMDFVHRPQPGSAEPIAAILTDQASPRALTDEAGVTAAAFDPTAHRRIGLIALEDGGQEYAAAASCAEELKRVQPSIEIVGARLRGLGTPKRLPISPLNADLSIGDFERAGLLDTADALMVVGRLSAASAEPLANLFALFAANGKPCVLEGVAVPSTLGCAAADQLSRLVLKSSAVSVRDHFSRFNLRGMGIARAVMVRPDPALTAYYEGPTPWHGRGTGILVDVVGLTTPDGASKDEIAALLSDLLQWFPDFEIVIVAEVGNPVALFLQQEIAHQRLRYEPLATAAEWLDAIVASPLSVLAHLRAVALAEASGANYIAVGSPASQIAAILAEAGKHPSESFVSSVRDVQRENLLLRIPDDG